METNEILEKLTCIFQQVFEDDTLIVNKETSATDIEEWNSMNNSIIVAMIEEEFGFRFKLRQLANINSIGDFVDVIKENA